MLTRTFRYGCRSPIGWGGTEDLILARQTDYWNRLRQIDSEARERYHSLVENDPELQKIKEVLKEEADPKKRRILTLEIKDRRASILRAIDPQLQLLRSQEKKARTEARQNSQLWWHHYLSVAEEYEKARRLLREHGAMPACRTLGDACSLTLRFPRGLSVSDLEEGKCSLLKETPGTKTKNRRLLLFAVGVEAEKTYRYLTVPVLWHRPLPSGAIIKKAQLLCRRSVAKTQWELHLSLEFPPCAHSTPPKPTACAVDYGWRITPNGMRVAYWVGSDGREGELLLDNEWLNKQRYLSLLRQEIQKESQFYAEAIQKQGLLNEKQVAHPTKSLLRLRRRKGLSAEISAILDAWWQSNSRKIREVDGLSQRLSNRRANLYQRAARDLAMHYKTVITEKIALGKLKKLQGETAPRAIQLAQDWACISLLEHWIEVQCETLERVWTKQLAMDTTIKCHICGHINTQSTKPQIITCESCAQTWDQDKNACLNFLKSVLI